MKSVGEYKKVTFSSIAEVRSFIKCLGKAYYYNKESLEFFPLMLGDDGKEIKIGLRKWQYTKEQLENTFGYIKTK